MGWENPKPRCQPVSLFFRPPPPLVPGAKPPPVRLLQIGLILPSSYGWIRPVPHHIAWWTASSWRWLVPFRPGKIPGGRKGQESRKMRRKMPRIYEYMNDEYDMIQFHGVLLIGAGFKFQKITCFCPIHRDMIAIWRSYFSSGLKPPKCYLQK